MLHTNQKSRQAIIPFFNFLLLSLILFLSGCSRYVPLRGSNFDKVNIVSVRSYAEQKCTGLGINLFSSVGHKDYKEIEDSGIVPFKNLGFYVVIPRLFGIKQPHITTFLNDKSRGVVDNYLWISYGNDALKPPFAAVVITELPKKMQSKDYAFSNVKLRHNIEMKVSGGNSIDRSFIDESGEVIEFIVKNRVGTYCFPTSNYKFLPSDYPFETYGISRFRMIDGKLIEFSLIVTTAKYWTTGIALDYTRKHMDVFDKSLKKVSGYTPDT